MKNVIKKAAALLAAVLMIAAVSSSALAAPTARPRSSAGTTQSSSSSDSSSSSEDSESSSEDSDEDSDSSSSSEDSDKSTSSPSKATEKPIETQPPVVTATPAAPATNKSYTTKGGAFLWFLLSIIVNTAISFAIGKRFYKLAKQSNRVQAEIRALRHDIEEKFVESVDGFAEPAIDITNMNDDYSSSPDGIKMTPASTTNGDGTETEDIYKQWEAQFGARHSHRIETRSANNTPKAEETDALSQAEYEEIDAPKTPKLSAKKYQPLRERRKAADDSEGSASKKFSFKSSRKKSDDYDKKSLSDGISGKFKGAVNKLFPMDDDE